MPTGCEVELMLAWMAAGGLIHHESPTFCTLRSHSRNPDAPMADSAGMACATTCAPNPDPTKIALGTLSRRQRGRCAAGEEKYTVCKQRARGTHQGMTERRKASLGKPASQRVTHLECADSVDDDCRESVHRVHLVGEQSLGRLSVARAAKGVPVRYFALVLPERRGAGSVESELQCGAFGCRFKGSHLISHPGMSYLATSEEKRNKKKSSVRLTSQCRGADACAQATPRGEHRTVRCC
jgi:hypothetical protein